MRGKTKILIATVGTFFLIAVLAVILNAIKKPQNPVESKAAAATTLAVIPASITKHKNETFPVTISINTGSNHVTAAALEVDFDATKLQVISISAGTFLTTVLTQGNISVPNKATITLGSGTSAQTGTGTLASLTFKVLADTGTTQISINNNTQVAATGEGDTNVVTTKTPSLVTIRVTIEGDLNDDGTVNLFDYNTMITHFGETGTPGWITADINRNGSVDIFDYNKLIQNYGTSN